MTKDLRDIQKRLDQYWKTTYADKLRREELENQKTETDQKYEQLRKDKLNELSLKIETYQEQTMNKLKKSEKDKKYEHERKCGLFLLDIRSTVRLMNEYDDKRLGRKERIEYDELKMKLKDLLEKLQVLDEDTWHVANKYVEDNLNVISIW